MDGEVTYRYKMGRFIIRKGKEKKRNVRVTRK